MKSLICIFFFLSISALYAANVSCINKKCSRNEIKYFKSAFEILKSSKNKIGYLTYKSLISNKAKLGLFKDLTYLDFKNVIQDLSKSDPSFSLKLSDYKKLRNSDTQVLDILEQYLEGYMWDDRIYVQSNLSEYELAKTLVHEVNHVLNKSEDHYYESKFNEYREEYRAHLAEALFENKNIKDKNIQNEIKDLLILNYDFSQETIDMIINLPKGKFYPTNKNWSK